MADINRIPTGHLDRNGQMIFEGDDVLVTVRPHYIKTDYSKERARKAQVLWSGEGWALYYGLQEQEPLNNYDSQELLKHTN